MSAKRSASPDLEINGVSNMDSLMDSSIRKISTFVFLDLETSALYTYDKPKIMELSMVAVHRRALCQSGSCHTVPRVLDKLTIVLNPNKPVSPKSFELTGLDNCNIIDSAKRIFDEDAVKLMQLFLRRQEQPVCLVAHNGDKFDFPVLRSELNKINQNLGDGVLCADSLIGCYETDLEISGGDTSTNNSKGENINNTTPVKQPRLNDTPKTPSKYVRQMPYGNGTPSYSLANVYKRTCGQDLTQAHSAEGDVMGLIKICKARGEKMCQWMDREARKLSDVQQYYMPSPPRACQRSLQDQY